MKLVSAFGEHSVPKAPKDPLFALSAACKADSSPTKVDLGIGVYRDDNEKSWVLPAVKQADDILHQDPAFGHEYLPITGLADFTSAAQRVALGASSPAIAENRVVSVQTVSGTGAAHLGALFLSKFYNPPTPEAKTVYMSSPTWANHPQIFANVQLPIQWYPYFLQEKCNLDFEPMISALQTAPDGSIVLLHACAHNPTGVDPTQDQWRQIAQVIKHKGHLPFFDNTYQGFASGSLTRDGWAMAHFVEQGLEFIVAQSFAKNLGLMGERAGCFHFITMPSPEAQDIAARVESQLAILQRSEISNPPAYGARLASMVLNNEKLFMQWEEDLRTMSGRIINMRHILRSKLEDMETPGTWQHITDQIGMFSFTGLREHQVRQLREQFHVYMTSDGRMSMAGVNSSNVDYIAGAVDNVVRVPTDTAKDG